MRCQKGSFLVEAIVACFITAVITASVASIIRLSVVIVDTSRESLAMERAREMALSYLSSGDPPPHDYSSNICVVSSSEAQQDGAAVYKIVGKCYGGERESFVLWTYKKN